ncbi:MAG TPA: hypothetical protein VK885_07040, partial [Desulfotignum sp.]|nr:hypothetical protein [Desulfotignum sp.]
RQTGIRAVHDHLGMVVVRVGLSAGIMAGRRVCAWLMGGMILPVIMVCSVGRGRVRMHVSICLHGVHMLAMIRIRTPPKSRQNQKQNQAAAPGRQ